MDPYCDAIKKLLAKEGQSTPRTFFRLSEELPYSRLTILKHLNDMERQGLVFKSVIPRETRGRPKLLYQPTLLLLAGKPDITIPFSILSENCIHRNGEKCRLSPGPCEVRRCPLLRQK